MRLQENKQRSQADVFINMIIAAMKDAVEEDKLTQIKSQILDSRGKLQHCRIIVIPEKMKMEWPGGLGG